MSLFGSSTTMQSARCLRADIRALSLPDFQRGIEWTESDVFDFLDSLVRGFPVGTIVIHQSYRDGKHVMDVVDGQQRIAAMTGLRPGGDPAWDVWIDTKTLQWQIGKSETAIPLWYDTLWVIGKSKTFGGADAIAAAIKKLDAVQYAQIPVTSIADITDDEMLDVFRRINNSGVKISRATVARLAGGGR